LGSRIVREQVCELIAENGHTGGFQTDDRDTSFDFWF
jgi:hypothetical protein